MNYRMTIQYDGTRYNGWQRQQATDNTIQGKIEDVLERMTGSPVEIHGAGRTDAGVHALGQIANVHLSADRSPEEIRTYLNTWLPEDIGVTSIAEAAPRFHSRLNATGKVYCYRIATDPSLHVFDRKYLYPFSSPLDVDAMKAAATFCIGEHDFQSFCTRKMKKSSIRRIDSITFARYPGELAITYTGNGFLYNMIRILTGTFLEVGCGQKSAAQLPDILEAKNRSLAGFTAPARGLTLTEVLYS